MRTNRIADTATVRLENSPLSLYGGTRYTVFTNTLTEKIGPLYLDGGYNRIVVQYGYTNGYPGSPIYGITNSGHVRLTCDALYRSNGAVASFWGGDRNGNFDQTDLGRSGTSASSVTVLDTSNFGAINGLLPWATVGQPNRSTAENRFTRFCKYDATDGFQPFNEGVDDQLGFGGATGTTNVRLAAGTTVSSDVTVNSLSLRYPTSISTFTLDRDVAGRTITLNSGAFLVAPTGNVNNLTINVNPDLNFAGQHAYIHNMSAGAGALAVYGTFKNIGADGITLSSYNNGYVMFGVSQTWTCPTYCVNGGVKFHGNDVGPTNTAFRVSKGAWLVFNQDSSVYIKSLSGDGPLYGKMSGWNDFGASSFFYIGDASDATFNGNIYSGESLPTQSGNLTKQGAGTWTVNGSSYLTNTTTVAAGTLVVNGSFALNSSMTVSNGATLGGTGTVAVLTVAAGGTLAPGAAASNAIGTLAVSGAMTLSSNTTCRVEIQNAGGTAGRGWDLVSATGALTLTATSANKATIKVVSLGANGQPGAATNWTGVQSWKIISASSVSGFVPNSFTVDTSALSGVDIALGVSDTGPAGTGLYLVKLTRGTVLSTY
jgi:autotransporter-associated beta strand protein